MAIGADDTGVVLHVEGATEGLLDEVSLGRLRHGAAKAVKSHGEHSAHEDSGAGRRHSVIVVGQKREKRLWRKWAIDGGELDVARRTSHVARGRGGYKGKLETGN
jgi:hypothetical protein